MDIFRSAETDTFFSYDEVAVDDEFERRAFSSRLARIIMEERGGKPLVVSIVNPWGGGKSTILQYIKDAIAATTRDESSSVKNCRITSFNLWRYAGEDQLLYRMFESLIQAINRDTPLTTGQTLLQRLPTWIKRFSIVCELLAPGVGVLLDSVFATISPEEFKVRLDEVRNTTREHLAKTGMRVIMLLDDVDRLDPDEILLLFRALKLIADLPNTTFVIAMDEEHVSEVIGKRIGGDSESGRRYIEKIVTVRLAVPKIPDDVFEDYVLRRCVEVWRRELNVRAKHAMAIGLSQQAQRLDPDSASIERMISIFRVLHLPYILTPRTVKTIQNAFAFALGLLPDEVDAGDVLLLEATRLLHPKLYLALPQVIPSLSKLAHQDRMQAMMDEGTAEEGMKKEKAKIVGELVSLIDSSPFTRKDLIEKALTDWFPILRSFTFEREDSEGEQAKHISSPNYFWRYYSGAVHKRDVHDTVVARWLHLALEINDDSGAVEQLRQHLRNPYHRAFLNKLEQQLLGRKDAVRPAIIIAKAVANLSETCDSDSQSALWHHAASVIARIIEGGGDAAQRVVMATTVARSVRNHRLNFVIFDCLGRSDYLTKPERAGGQPLVPSTFDEELAEQSLAAYEQGDVPADNDLICKMVWAIYRNSHIEGLQTRVRHLVEKNPQVGLQFLVGGCAFGSSSSHMAACWRWNGKKGLMEVARLLSTSLLKRILQTLPEKPHDYVESTGDFDYLTLTEVGWECADSLENQASEPTL
ncbi:MAG: hypothetical protein JNN17_06380 [Verrucomicrobiaceae bacterium]|nr:hypothetical protein [Verrucomicrobiaceae bacterium]